MTTCRESDAKVDPHRGAHDRGDSGGRSRGAARARITDTDTDRGGSSFGLAAPEPIRRAIAVRQPDRRDLAVHQPIRRDLALRGAIPQLDRKPGDRPSGTEACGPGRW